MKKNGIILLTVLIALSSCSTAQKGGSNQNIKTITLDFQKCLPTEMSYEEITIDLVKGFKKTKVPDYHGYCEYHINYSDGSVLFISTNIYSGSYINSDNRMSIGIDTYAKSRSVEPIDTIKNFGQQRDGRYWLEYILGDVVVGYINTSADRRELFDSAISTLSRKK